MRLLKAMRETKNFSLTEQSIIQYILENPRSVVDLSIRELAEKTFTSPAAIFRLCKKLGLKGYTEFKIKFTSEANRTLEFEKPQGERPITNQDTARSIVKKMAALEIEAIEETKNEMDMAQLVRVSLWLDQARQIDLYAFDENLYIAQMTSYNFLQIGKTVVVNPAANSQYMQALTSEPKTHVAILLSRTGENKRLIDIAKILKKKKVQMILLTPAKDSTLVKLCDEFLYVANTEEFLDMGGLIFSAGVRYYQDVLFGLLLSKHYEQVENIYDCFENIFGRLSDKWRLW